MGARAVTDAMVATPMTAIAAADTLLVVNAGSSSIKFALYGVSSSPAGLRPIWTGHVARVADADTWQIEDADGQLLEQSQQPTAGVNFDHEAALTRVFDWLDALPDARAPVAIGHRVVHGGMGYSSPVRVTDAVLRELTALVPWAPLHQPHNLAPVRAAALRWPGVMQVACFDTAFHRTQPAVAQAFALPRAITDAGVQRYGFHGLSFESVASQLPAVLGDRSSAATGHGKVIVAHLGHGASLCAIHGGKSVASTMGFSVLDGLVMGTRCGTLDAGVVLHLLQRGMTAQQVSDLLYEQSGLLGVSGLSGDMAVLLASSDPRAVQAIDLFVYRAVCDIGAMTAALGGLDALVFTAGIGEHAAPVRARVVAGCAWLGAVLDDGANSIDLELIHAPTSKVQLAVVATDEESVIAAHTLAHLR